MADFVKGLASVVITTRNRCAMVPRAIKSVLNQTYPNIELIVVDDCSDDETEAPVRSFGNRVLYVRHDKNKVSRNLYSNGRRD